mgnify:CR=1 FL=1
MAGCGGPWQAFAALWEWPDERHPVDLGPRFAPHSYRHLVGTGVRMLTAAHQDEGAGARDARPLQQELQVCNSAPAATDVNRQANVAVPLALAGFSLSVTEQGTYLVSRWDLSVVLPDLGAVESFLQRVAP